VYNKSNLSEIIERLRTNVFSDHHILFGILMFVNYPIYYFVFDIHTINSKISFFARFVASLLCLPLIFKKFWPHGAIKYYKAYWFYAVTYCLPFFVTYMTLLNHNSVIWLMNSISAMFFMLLLLNLRTFVLSLITGYLIAYSAYLANHDQILIDLGTISLEDIIGTFVTVVLIGSLFSYNHEKTQLLRQSSLKSIATAIAREMRIPLAEILIISQNIHKVIRRFKDDEVIRIESGFLLSIADSLETINKENSAFIDILLVKSSNSISKFKLERLNIVDSIKKIVSQYPYSAGEEKWVQMQLDADKGYFKGNIILLKHIMFNLLRNALYFTKEIHNSHITIGVEILEHKVVIFVEDKGPGIPSYKINSIFDKLSMSNDYGAGLGLVFCKMAVEEMKGKIYCLSELNKYTRFIIEFKRVD
jgi:signal transduction histidine kinase